MSRRPHQEEAAMTPDATTAGTLPYTATVILVPDAAEAAYFPDGTTNRIEMKVRASNRHAAVSVLRALGGPMQGNVLADWVGDTAVVPASDWEAAYARVHFPHIELTAEASHGSDDCQVTIKAPSIAVAHRALRLGTLPVFDEKLLPGRQTAAA